MSRMLLRALAIVDDSCAGVDTPQTESISRVSKSVRFLTVEVTVNYDVPTPQS